jgi:hypothetical protein
MNPVARRAFLQGLTGSVLSLTLRVVRASAADPVASAPSSTPAAYGAGPYGGGPYGTQTAGMQLYLPAIQKPD